MFDYIKEKFKPGGIFTKEDIDRYNYLMEVEKIRDECKEIARNTVRKGLINYLPVNEALELFIGSYKNLNIADQIELHREVFNMPIQAQKVEPENFAIRQAEKHVNFAKRYGGTLTGRIYSDKPNFTNVSKSK
jgi:hypothetical protein